MTFEAGDVVYWGEDPWRQGIIQGYDKFSQKWKVRTHRTIKRRKIETMAYLPTTALRTHK